MAVIKKQSNPGWDESLKITQEAINDRDGHKFLSGLFGSMLLEGYERVFKKRFAQLGEPEVRDEIAAAVDEIYQRIIHGEKITSIRSYLWKVIEGRLIRLLRVRAKFQRIEAAEKMGVRDSTIDVEPSKEELDRRRAHVISLAEGLIPRLGLASVQAVMKYLLGAIKNGAEDLTSTEIAEALGLTHANARQALNRGLARLGRIFREEKLVDSSYVFPFFEDPESFTDDEDNNTRQAESDFQY